MTQTQFVVVPDGVVDESQFLGELVLVNEDGTPWVPGGGGGEAATWATLQGKPAVIAAGADAAAARAAIGAGTGSSSLAVATTAPAALAAAAAVGTGTTAARADHVHPLPTAAQVGAAATSHNQAATTVTVAAGAGIVGANVQLVLADLAARVVALEGAGG